MHLNDFYFTGVVSTQPQTKAFQSNSKTQFDVEHTNNFRGIDKKTVITVQTWHKGQSHTQNLKPGDYVMVKGRFSSSPYKERNIMNLDATVVVPLPANANEQVAVVTPANSPADDQLPF